MWAYVKGCEFYMMSVSSILCHQTIQIMLMFCPWVIAIFFCGIEGFLALVADSIDCMRSLIRVK